LRRYSPIKFIFLSGVALVIALLCGLLSGATDISASKIWGVFSLKPLDMDHRILQSIRLPRVLLAALAGACLASCGAVMQGLFRNPLADPSLIGVSSGASVGASCIIFFGGVNAIGGMELPAIAIGAFVGGLLATSIVYSLATSVTGTSVATMLLAGIAITALSGAVTSLFSFFADNEMLRRISLWQMGNLDGADWPRTLTMGLVAIPLVLVLPREGQALNAMLLGESEARHLGVDVETMKRRLILLTALGVGVAVAVSGVVAFVGLIVPHLVRLIIGPDHRYLIPGSAILGAVLLVLADTAARTLMAPAELPTGVITALLGAPFFVGLLLQQRTRMVG
jgi:iron complex transport system permease protein